ncbi:MAG: hypothetical protein AAGK00_20220 [Pseudomonadota bacterium]
MNGDPYFVIFAAMRTGSNLLEKTLAELGDTVCHGEAFNPAFISGPQYTDCLGYDVARRDADPLGFLARMRAEAEPSIPGFRIFPGHNEDVARHALSDQDCRRIVLRRDPLESYISLKIARSTGQWMIRNARRRMDWRIAFDATEFQAYRLEIRAHYDWITDELARSGQAALWLDYADLTDRDGMERAARHIGSKGQLPCDPPIVRQNSPHLSDKVSNYAEMCAVLGLSPEPAPPSTGRVATDVVDGVKLPTRVPLAYAPIEGPGFEAALSFIYRIERRAFGGPSISNSALMISARRREYCPTLNSETDIVAQLQGRFAFTVVCHPMERLLSVFDRAVFGPDWQSSPVRAVLGTMFPDLPRPQAVAETNESALRDLFLAFINLVSEARGGRGPLPLVPAWRDQNDLLRSYTDRIHLDRVVRFSELKQFATDLSDRLGVAPLPDNHIDVLMDRARKLVVPNSILEDDEVISRLIHLLAADLKAWETSTNLG